MTDEIEKNGGGGEEIEPVFSENVSAIPEFKIPEIKNPHPNLKPATWIFLAAAVILGSFAYYGFITRMLTAKADSPVIVNGVTIPSTLAGFPLEFGSDRKHDMHKKLAATPPESGMLKGVIYGSPAAGRGLVLFTTGETGNESLEEYSIRILSLIGSTGIMPNGETGGAMLFAANRDGEKLEILLAAAVNKNGRYFLVAAYHGEGGREVANAAIMAAAAEILRMNGG